MNVQEELRKLPSVDRLLQEATVDALVTAWGHSTVVAATREALDNARQAVLGGESCPPTAALAQQVEEQLAARLRPTLRPVINATGVLLHTNLGRAPLSIQARMAMDAVALGYSNLEYDLDAGQRGSRYIHAEEILCRLTGAEAALVVNNNAAAVLLILMALTRGREAVISRGQLVEIGGGFRIPDVMRQSGAMLVEVGTTNRTYVQDYEAAITDATTALMRVHRSNFRLMGFVHEPSLTEMVELATERNLFVFDDLGSGTLLDTAQYGLTHEPTIQESLAAGVSLVSCSGDKLLGGPQAGLIVGHKALIQKIKKNPLKRALRVDKLTLAALEAVLNLYRDPDRLAERLTSLRLLSRPQAEIRAQAERIAPALAAVLGESWQIAVSDALGMIGSGAQPVARLPSAALCIRPQQPKRLRGRSLRQLEEALRCLPLPVLGRIDDDALWLDLRQLDDEPAFLAQLPKLQEELAT